jgi:hypothetical protein
LTKGPFRAGGGGRVNFNVLNNRLELYRHAAEDTR